MKNYVDYRDNGDTEERVQVTQAFCNTEEEIAEAIERSKRDLKKSDVPYGYQKLDEEIITTVYKIPDNEIIDETVESNEINKKYRKIYKNEYENNQNAYSNYTNIKGGKIQNFYENEISKDGQYLVSMTLSKKVMDEKNSNRPPNMYKNNYYKEEIEVNENDGEQRYVNIPFKNNYNFQNRNQEGYGKEYYVTKEEINRNKYYPIRSERKVTRYYRDENYGEDDDEDEKGNKDFKKVINTQAQSMHFPAKYKKGEFNYYDY